ncbi:MAG: EF-hand domain-containing protein [Candidatus Methylomirabilaceae bacterium]
MAVRYLIKGVAIALVAAMPAALMAAAVASGQQPSPAQLRSIFDKADQNNDGHLDRLEFLSRQTEVFNFIDADTDAYLTAVEIRRHYPMMTQRDFEAADRDRDGKLSLDEFLRAASMDFHQADKDQNGKMNFEEFLASMQVK